MYSYKDKKLIASQLAKSFIKIKHYYYRLRNKKIFYYIFWTLLSGYIISIIIKKLLYLLSRLITF